MSENYGQSSLGPSPWLVSRRQQREKIAAGTNQVFDRSPPPIDENEDNQADNQVLIIESDSESDSSSDSSMSEKNESSDDVIHIEGPDSHFIKVIG